MVSLYTLGICSGAEPVDGVTDVVLMSHIVRCVIDTADKKIAKFQYITGRLNEKIEKEYFRQIKYLTIN